MYGILDIRSLKHIQSIIYNNIYLTETYVLSQAGVTKHFFETYPFHVKEKSTYLSCKTYFCAHTK